MKILFYDGDFLTAMNNWITIRASCIAKDGCMDCASIDAAEGPSKNMIKLDELRDQKIVLFTNSILALSHVYGWNKEEGHTDIYLWREKYKDFIRCDKLTLKEIREAHNIEKMYMSGSFEEEIPELPEHLKGI